MTSRARAPRRTARSPLAWVVGAVAVAAAAFFGFGYLFAGSQARLADGVRIAGVDVGGLTPGQAQRLLERRFEDVQRTPIRFVAGGKKFDLMAVQLGIEPDFADAVKAAQDEGDGFGPLRGYRRLRVRLGDADLQPRVAVWDEAVRFHVEKIAKAVDR